MGMNTSGQTAQFKTKGSLTRTVILSLVILGLIPSILLVSATFFRSRALLAEQASFQLQSIVNNHVQQLEGLVADNHVYLDEMLKNDLVSYVIKDVLRDPESEASRYIGRYQFSTYIAETRNIKSVFPDQAFLLSPSGKILLSSKLEWEGVDASQIQFIQELINQKSSIAVLNPENFYTDQWIVFSSSVIFSGENQPVATLVLTTNAPTTKNILISAGSLFPSSKAFLFSGSKRTLFSINETKSNQISNFPINNNHFNKLDELVKAPESSVSYRNSNQDSVLAYVKNIPALKMGFLIEVPERIIYQQVNLLIPFSLLIFSVAIIISVSMTYWGSRRLIKPLVQLANHAQNFAQGDFSQRAKISRNDEIGLLANSFNNMVSQLSDLYRSMETKVEERTSQLRTASEIGQLAISSTSRDQMVQRAVNLIVERFNFCSSSIFLVDESGTNLILKGSHHQGDQSGNNQNPVIHLDTGSLLGWVVTNNQTRVADKSELKSLQQATFTYPSTTSIIALPIAANSIVFGVLEVQTDQPNGFESETITVLQTLANQLATGFQNIRLLEAVQIDLEETTLLYRTSRQVSLTKNASDLNQVLVNSLSQTTYVCGIYSLNRDHISILALIDPTNPSGILATQGVTIPLQDIDQKFVSNNLVLIDNLTKPTEFDYLLSFFARRGCKSAAVFPIFESQTLVRLIVLGTRNQTPLTDTGLQPFTNLVEVVSTTLERFHALEELQHRVNELTAFESLSAAISSETDPQLLFSALHKEITQTIGSDLSFAIALYDKTNNTINLPFLYENSEVRSVDSFPLGEGLTSIIIRTKKPLFLAKDTEAQAKALGAKILGKPAKSWMGIPLIVGGEPVGAMILQDTVNEERFTDADLNLAVTLAPQIATTVRNSQLLNQMQNTLQAYEQERFLLNSLMANIPDRIYFKDNQGRFLRVSKSLASDAGSENPDQFIGKNIFNFVPGDQADKITEEETRLLDMHSSIQGRVERGEIGNQNIWFQTSKIPLEDDKGNIVGLLGISSDITSLKQVEEESQKRADQLQIAAEVARDTSGTLVIQETLQKAVNLVRDRFGFYHASIFLLNPLGNYAVLREATGEVGAKMVASGHRLAVGSQSVVGQATARREITVINDVQAEPNYYPNPLLPETRGEATIPLIVGDKLLGAIDIQSREVNSFTPDAINVLKILADQLAIAVMNANLFARIQENLAQHRLLHQITVATASTRNEEDALGITVEALKTSRGGDRVSIYFIDGDDRLLLKAYAGFDLRGPPKEIITGDGAIGLAALQRKPIRIDDAIHDPQIMTSDPEIRSILAVPILYSNRLIGILNLESLEPAAYDETDQEILGSLGSTLGAILANTQLVLTIQKQIERQRTLYEATNRIRRSVDIQSILSISSSEICKALGARRAHIEITAGKDQPLPDNHPGNNGHKKPEGQL